MEDTNWAKTGEKSYPFASLSKLDLTQVAFFFPDDSWGQRVFVRAFYVPHWTGASDPDAEPQCLNSWYDL